MTIFEIRNKLNKNEIDYSEAFEHIKKFPNPWHTKEWELKRSKIIKSECEQCKITEGIMVAQHLIQPIGFKTIRNAIFNSRFSEFLNSTTLPKQVITVKDIKEFHDKTTKIREACPHCKWIRIRKRTTMKPEYFCEICKIDFDEAVSIEYNEIFKTIFPTEEQVTNYLIRKNEDQLIADLKRNYFAKIDKEIGKEAMLISIEQHLKYMEFENVVTFCKRCAAKMDLDKLLLCYTCKTEYFRYEQYECCFKCFGKNELIANPIKAIINNT